MLRILVRSFCVSGKKYLRTELPPPETKFKTREEDANVSSPPQLHLLIWVRILLAIPTQPHGDGALTQQQPFTGRASKQEALNRHICFGK